MIVNMGRKTYTMTSKQFKKFLEAAKKCLKFGIYAIEKDGVAVMLNQPLKNHEELEKEVSEYRKKGFKVYWNENKISKG